MQNISTNHLTPADETTFVNTELSLPEQIQRPQPQAAPAWARPQTDLSTATLGGTITSIPEFPQLPVMLPHPPLIDIAALEMAAEAAALQAPIQLSESASVSSLSVGFIAQRVRYFEALLGEVETPERPQNPAPAFSRPTVESLGTLSRASSRASTRTVDIFGPEIEVIPYPGNRSTINNFVPQTRLSGTSSSASLGSKR